MTGFVKRLLCVCDWPMVSINQVGSSRILVASVQDGGFLRHRLLRPKGVQKAVSAEQRSSRLRAPLARYRPEYPFPSCVPAELESVFPGTYESTTFQRHPPNHWTQEPMPSKIHHASASSTDENRTSAVPPNSAKNHLAKVWVQCQGVLIIRRYSNRERIKASSDSKFYRTRTAIWRSTALIVATVPMRR